MEAYLVFDKVATAHLNLFKNNVATLGKIETNVEIYTLNELRSSHYRLLISNLTTLEEPKIPAAFQAKGIRLIKTDI